MEKRVKILMIDDEADNLEVLQDLLSPFYDIVTASDGAKGVQAARECRPDIILLDLNMPQLDGSEVCRLIRSDQASKLVPIIMVSGADDTESRSRAFERGADDFVARPFKIKELILRIKSKERWVTERESGKEVLVCGNLQLNLAKLEATIESRSIPMSVLHFNLLKLFVENPDQVVSRNRILESVWSDSVVGDRTIDSHISHLRKKLTKGGFNHTLGTVYGAGYILKAT